MNTYIAFLRGINVGGKNKIKMDDLKRVFKSIGLNNVRTYIQSGNIIFESSQNEDTLIKYVESEIKKTFDINTSVILRTENKLKDIILSCPFSDEEISAARIANSDGESFYIALLSHPPLKEEAEHLNSYKSDNDNFKIINRDIYILLRHSIRYSRLSDKILKLNASVTVRSFNTLKKLSQMTSS